MNGSETDRQGLLFRRGLRWVLFAAITLLTGTGCNSTKEIDLTKDRDGDAKSPVRRVGREDDSEEKGPVDDKPFVQVNPNVIIGQIVYVNPEEMTGVIRLDNAYPVEGRFLVAVSPTRDPLAVVETMGGLQGRSIGFRLADGAAAVGIDVLLPSRQWALQLRERYAVRNRDRENPDGGASVGPAGSGGAQDLFDAPVRVEAVPVR